MRRIATASAVLLLGIGACTNPLDTPTDLQEEIALPAAVRSEYEPGPSLGIFNPPGFVKTLQPGETDGQFVQVTVLSPVITSLTLEVCDEDKELYAGWLQSVIPEEASVPTPPLPPVASFDIVVGPPLDAEIKTHLFKICAVGNGTTFVASQQVTIVIPDITAPVITLLGSDPVNVEAGETYTDAGATALDDVDGDITASIITDNPVDTDVPGTYTVTYNVSDAAGNPAVQVTRTVNVEVPTSTTIDVTIDIKPGSDPNSINLGSKGKGNGKTAGPNAKISVALFSRGESDPRGEFDATQVDVSTVTLGDLTDPDTGVVLKRNGTYQASAEDVNGDGLMDMVFHFSRAELIANFDLTEDSEGLYLTGTHVDGDIEGWDSVRVIN